MEKLTFYSKATKKDNAKLRYSLGFIEIRPTNYQGVDNENAFARRLVAAFNATRHVPVETLETDPLTLDGVEDTFNRLKAQNAQLLEALKGVIRVADRKTVEFDAARAAIAAATITEKTETP